MLGQRPRAGVWGVVVLVVAGLIALFVVGGPGPRATEDLPAGAALPPDAAPPTGAEDGPSAEPPLAAAGRATASAAMADEAGAVVVEGQVVDDRRRAVPDAVVRARIPGFEEVRTRVDADGRYRLMLGSSARAIADRGAGLGIVLAADPRGRQGAEDVYVGPDSRLVAVKNIVIQAGATLIVGVERDGQPVVDARVTVRRMDSYAALPIAEGPAPAGEAQWTVAPGAYRIVASARGQGRGVAVGTVRADRTERVVVELAAARTVVVRVVRADDASPIAGADVRVTDVLVPNTYAVGQWASEFVTCRPTDAEGRTVVEGLGRGDAVTLTVRATGYGGISPDDMPTTAIVAAGAPDRHEVTVRLAPLVPCRWPLVLGDVPSPPPGTELRVVRDTSAIGATLPPTVRVEGSSLVGDGFSIGPIHAYALAGDGSFARLFRGVGAGDGAPTSFVRRPSLEVEVIGDAGAPEPGVSVELVGFDDRRVAGPGRTDDRGRVTLLPDAPAHVFVVAGRSDASRPGDRLGEADLRRQPHQHLSVRRTAERDVVLSVRIDGEPALPGFVEVTYGNRQASIVAEDPAAGVLHVQVAVPEPPRQGRGPFLSIRAPGFAPAFAVVQADRAGGPLRASVELVTSGVLRIEVRLPSSGTRPRLMLQRFDEATGRWQPAQNQSSMTTLETRVGTVETTANGLAAGRYRVAAFDFGVVGDDVVIEPGRETRTVLDLGAVGHVSGRVEAPPGTTLTSAVIVRDLGIADLPFEEVHARTNVRPDGSFAIGVPGTRPVRLRVTHPDLVADGGSDPVVVTTPRSGLVLSLVASGSVRFSLSGSAAVRPASVERPRLVVTVEGPGAARTVEAQVRRDGDHWVVGGLPQGVLTLWIDAGYGVPMTRAGVVVAQAQVDLGSLAVQPGASIRLRFVDREPARRRVVSVVALGDPSYARGVQLPAGAREGVVNGLGSGRFQLVVRPADPFGGPAQAIERELEVDGTQDVELVLDGNR